jgi:putative transposase
MFAATRDSRVTRTVLDAALRRRRPDAGLIFHTDRGSEFQGTRVRTRLTASAVRQSMTRGGAPGENAHMESFFHSLKADADDGGLLPVESNQTTDDRGIAAEALLPQAVT